MAFGKDASQAKKLRGSWLGNPANGKLNRKARALSEGALDADGASVRLDHTSSQRQTQSGSVTLSGIERPEDVG